MENIRKHTAGTIKSAAGRRVKIRSDDVNRPPPSVGRSALNEPSAGILRKLSMAAIPTVVNGGTDVIEAGASVVERYLRVYPDRETTFTDKDRAAAVAMGTKDIKVSLQVKKKRERRRDEPGEREFRIRFALADRELRSANPSRALHFVVKALELRPKSRECFVIRSKCHLMLGQPNVALEDAERALLIDAEYVKGVCAKADALFALGDFEHALVCYHRGRHLRPESEEFRLGIQKAEEAIQNVINYNNKSNKHCKDLASSSAGRSLSRHSPTSGEKVQPASDLQPDIEFLTKLLKNNEIRSLRQPESRIIKKHVNEVLDFLNSRQDFWSQQKPRNT